MAEYIAFDPKVEVKGAAVLSVIIGLKEMAMEAKATEILTHYNLFPVEAEAWYPQQVWLDAFREISKTGHMNLVSIGMKIPDVAAFPPDLDTVEKALGLLDVAYQMNHRGGEIGEYHFSLNDEHSGVMTCNNPYPSDFDFGLVYRMVQKFRPATSRNFQVKLDPDKTTRKQGGDSCTYLLTW